VLKNQVVKYRNYYGVRGVRLAWVYDSLVNYVMDTRGAAPRPSTVREIANILLATREEASLSTVGKNWPSTFINRRPKLRTCFSRRYDYQRALNKDPKSIRQWFATVQSTINENGI
jgi:hypothetical protein